VGFAVVRQGVAGGGAVLRGQTAPSVVRAERESAFSIMAEVAKECWVL